MYTQMHAYVRTHVHTCIYMYTRTHKHIHMHTHTFSLSVIANFSHQLALLMLSPRKHVFRADEPQRGRLTSREVQGAVCDSGRINLSMDFP